MQFIITIVRIKILENISNKTVLRILIKKIYTTINTESWIWGIFLEKLAILFKNIPYNYSFNMLLFPTPPLPLLGEKMMKLQKRGIFFA